ncbi:UNVERIFIED_ORG: polysaccharide pyruvyl transferase WcaK-like protein [Rhizobium sophorae]|uniref:polysaccharide pyruvyl transferase family protein n=1 Tax=Rhizobium leguminosarum TaxID=384 RepID=UPI000DE3E4E4|nr:polysaccharide pyruvyl transferase family protein [Rhizobium leguminosarum]MBB4526527.1 polysaccharide pyruvyl transferase WcaK-like protein [Rhizobium leguminosarum]MDH6663652.1 polysaccharide pyruvyl transferase WcaK-like protein [Rhizobium sophorae]
MSQGRTLLISRLTTQNAGNEALSKQFLKYFASNAGRGKVLALDRYPRYFESFSLKGLGANPVQSFDNLARDLIRRFSDKNADALPEAREGLVKLDESAKELTGFLRKVKRKIALRKTLSSLLLIEKPQLLQAVTGCTTSDLIVWNPAGEIHPTGSADQVMRLLLLLRIGQLSGRKTAVINHSLEIVDERLRALIAHVYSHLDYVGVRDAKSVEVALSLGVSKERLYESPDLVFLASREQKAHEAKSPKGSIALAINGLEALSGSNEWVQFMKGLEEFKRPIVFVSNAVNHDRDFSTYLAGLTSNGTVVEHQPGYIELRSFYKDCAVLVSSRLHASILALCEGTPVLSIEPSVFKLTAIFEQMNYPIKTVRLQDAGWSEKVLGNIRSVIDQEGPDLVSQGARALAHQVELIDQSFKPLFAMMPDGKVA